MKWSKAVSYSYLQDFGPLQPLWLKHWHHDTTRVQEAEGLRGDLGDGCSGQPGQARKLVRWTEKADILSNLSFFFFLLFFQALWTWSHHWHTTVPHVVRSYRSGPFNKSIDRSETIIFPMDHQQLGAAGSNRYSWIRWSCPHAMCQRVTNNHIAAHYSLT